MVKRKLCEWIKSNLSVCMICIHCFIDQAHNLLEDLRTCIAVTNYLQEAEMRVYMLLKWIFFHIRNILLSLSRRGYHEFLEQHD